MTTNQDTCADPPATLDDVVGAIASLAVVVQQLRIELLAFPETVTQALAKDPREPDAFDVDAFRRRLFGPSGRP